MKRESIPASRGLLIIYRITVVLILVLLAVLIAGSLYGIIRSPDAPLFRIGKAGDGEGQNSGPGYGMAGIFSGIGKLRIPLAGQTAAGSPPAAIILSITFPYPADDRPFAGELASRTGDFRSIAAKYFESLPREQFIRFDEESAKTELLKRYNTILRLGKIETLYFSDFMIID